MISKKKTSILLFLLCFFLSTEAQVKIELKWESDTIFDVPESVIYDTENNLIYVANISGSPIAKDNNGFISIMNTDGKIQALKWISGLNAPKGMGIFNNKLYVADIDQLLVIDIKQGIVIKRYPAINAKFLNDVCIDPNGIVYVSDFKDNKIYRLFNDKFEIWLEDEHLKGPNGLFFSSELLFVGIRGSILSVDPEMKTINIVAENTGGIDGLNRTHKGDFVVSDWRGKVQLISPGKQKLVLFDHTSEKINAADIYLNEDNEFLLVPTFYHNTIRLYNFDY